MMEMRTIEAVIGFYAAGTTLLVIFMALGALLALRGGR